jgi:ABC-type nitrate/sulfonate/bicarbonate transport system permease component
MLESIEEIALGFVIGVAVGIYLMYAVRRYTRNKYYGKSDI